MEDHIICLFAHYKSTLPVFLAHPVQVRQECRNHPPEIKPGIRCSVHFQLTSQKMTRQNHQHIRDVAESSSGYKTPTHNKKVPARSKNPRKPSRSKMKQLRRNGVLPQVSHVFVSVAWGPRPKKDTARRTPRARRYRASRTCIETGRGISAHGDTPNATPPPPPLAHTYSEHARREGRPARVFRDAHGERDAALPTHARVEQR